MPPLSGSKSSIRVQFLAPFQEIKAKFTLEQAVKAQREVQVLLYTFFNLVTRWWWVVNAKSRPI